MNDPICRWGILSTAEIGKKNWHAIQLAAGAELIAVASRDRERAQQFVRSCQEFVPMTRCPDALGSYEELLQREDIDAVYIPLPTGMRKAWVIRAATAGKHVLCEKPCAIDARDLQDMIDACKDHNVQFMDGVMFMHTERTRLMRDVIDHQLGAIRRVHSQLTFCGDEEFRRSNIRTHGELEPHGCLGDLGWYNIRLALWAMKWEMPVEVRARALSSHQQGTAENSVPMSLSAELDFGDCSTASFYCSFEDHHQQWAVIGGESGFLRVNDFVLPYADRQLSFELNQADFLIDLCQFDMHENSQTFQTDESGNNAIDSPETKLFDCFSRIVLRGSRDEHWERISLKTQQVLDACFESSKRNGATVKIAKS